MCRGEAFARVNVDAFVFIPANASPLRYGNAKMHLSAVAQAGRIFLSKN